MPFARFQKLASEKRQLILDVAAQEFAAHGFENASINRILEHAQLSKGAAYYYFEDKVDLFCTVVQYANDRLQLVDEQTDLELLTSENFWSIFAAQHRLPLLRSFEQPWLFAALRATGQLSSAALEREPLASLVYAIRSHVMSFIKRGQEIGIVRNDIPDELIFLWLQGLDDACDTWLTKNWSQLDRAAIALISDQTVDAMRRALASL
jgi:AcrR family transcriptional regulator